MKTAEKETAAKCREFGVDADCFICDVTDFAGCGEMVKKVAARFGSLDVLVNNAGITKDGLLVRMSEEQYDAVINVNMKSVFNMTRHAGALMMRQRSGRIINISSVAGVYGNAGQFNYSASKAGIIGMTMTAAKELGSRNITVNAVAPGFIDTQMTAVLPRQGQGGSPPRHRPAPVWQGGRGSGCGILPGRPRCFLYDWPDPGGIRRIGYVIKYK